MQVDAGDQTTTLKAILEAETGIPAARQQLLYNGKQLSDGQSLGSQGVGAGDLIMLLQAVAAPAPSAAANAPPHPAQSQRASINPDGSLNNPQAIMQQLRANPAALHQLPAAIAEAVRANDIAQLEVGALVWYGGCVQLCGVEGMWKGGSTCARIPPAPLTPRNRVPDPFLSADLWCS
jgi:hypothetical protein